ncbi:MAG: hypothetical protein K2X93_26050 [Candidatus Obscuribacterales bacterium]|nr:hypothetical protein [Candidatus Obscuribacterales bacterium]
MIDDSPSFEGLFSDDYLGNLTNRHGLPRNLVSEVALAEFNIGDHERAVVFYHGAWSGPSAAALKLLCTAMSARNKQIPIFLVNADSLNASNSADIEKAKELFGQHIGAWGETCWIRNGDIVARDILGRIRSMHESSKDYSVILKPGAERHQQMSPSLEELKIHIQERINLVNS